MIMLELKQKSRIHWSRLLYHVSYRRDQTNDNVRVETKVKDHWSRLLYHISYRRDQTNDNVRVETKVKDPLVQTAVSCII